MKAADWFVLLGLLGTFACWVAVTYYRARYQIEREAKRDYRRWWIAAIEELRNARAPRAVARRASKGNRRNVK